MLTAYQRTIHDKQLRIVSDDMHVGEWIHLEVPTAAEIHDAAEKLKMDADVINDVLDPYEAPRFEKDGPITYVFLRYPRADEQGTAPFLVAVSDIGVLTVSREKTPFMERFTSGALEFYTTQKTRLVLLLIAEITAEYTNAMTDIQRAVNRTKQRIEAMTENDLVEIAAYESVTVDFLGALIPQGTALATLATGKTLVVFEKDRDLLEDVMLSTSQLIELAKSTMKAMGNTRDTYMAISSQRLNTVIRRLTALTILVTIPNVITGFYGMNVALFGQNDAGVAVYILAFIVAATGTTAFLLLKNRWL